jgi:hypothetical protein
MWNTSHISWQARQAIITTFILSLISPLANAQIIPSTLGWYQIPNTKLRVVCPNPSSYQQIQGMEGCAAIVDDWSGGAFDTARNRLLILGGGHAGYAGNEVYALDLDTATMQRLNEPSTSIRDGCAAGGTYSDGKPVARHTYNHLEYLPKHDAIFLWGGSQWQCGGMAGDTWLFDLPTLTWSKKTSTSGPKANFGRAVAYDPNTGLVYARDDWDFFSFDPATNTWSKRNSSSVGINDYKTAVIDPVRKKYFLHGNGLSTVYWYDISSPTATIALQSGQTSGCAGFIGNYEAGMAYDPVQEKIIGWSGGNTVYILDPDMLNCTTLSYSGGPSAVPNGTFGRFRYSAALNIFTVCNSVDANCYVLRLTPGAATPSTPDAAPAVVISATPISISSGSASTLTWSSTNASSCAASGGWSGTKAISGYQGTGNLTANTTFVLTCTGSGGSTSQSALVTVGSSTTPPPTSTTNSTLLVKFGQTSSLNSFGLSGWSTVIKDIYTDYRDLGPGGTTIVTGDNYTYNYQGVAGSQRNFATGEKIRVTWYNNSTGSITVTPKISLTDPDRPNMGSEGIWYSMSSINVPPLGTAVSEYILTASSAGSYSVVNVNANYSNTQVLIAHKIELLPSGSSTPLSTSFDFSLANDGSKSVTQGQSVSNSTTAVLTAGTASLVVFSASGLPSGAAATFSSVSCVPSCSSTLNIVTAASTPVGSRPITISAIGGGVTKTTGFSLTVNASTSTSPPSSTPSADADFQARCSAPGVLVCKGFDDPSAFVPAVWPNPGLYPGGDGVYRGTLDTTIKRSGAGSLRFAILGSTGANSAGQWRQNFGQNFGAGQVFYVQFKQRFDVNMLTLRSAFGGGGWKQVIFHDARATCAQVEITTNNQNYRGFPSMYTACGSGLSEYNSPDGYILEYSQPYPPGSSGTTGTDYYCNHSLLSGPAANNRCAWYQADQWMTFYYEIKIGNWGQSNSTLRGYVGYEGQPLKAFVNHTAFTLNRDTSDSFFNYLTLLAYDTGKDGRQHPTAYTWYDELIVSTQPIAVPGGSVANAQSPAAPSNLTIQ